MEKEEFLNGKFFLIDSNNLESIGTRLYGFSVTKNGIIQNENYNENTPITSTGAYVLVKKKNDIIEITQDFNGCYGIYLYKKDDYFAISNSFLYLVEYLSGKFNLSFNWDYANAFLPTDLCSFAYTETLVNEIQMLPKNTILRIEGKYLQISYIDYSEYSIPIGTQEGMDSLDDWFRRWTGCIRNIKSKTNNMSVDISGGFDSRCTMALMLASNIDLNKVKINSINDKLHCHEEDFKIASQIAKHFNFELNRNTWDTKYDSFQNIS